MHTPVRLLLSAWLATGLLVPSITARAQAPDPAAGPAEPADVGVAPAPVEEVVVIGVTPTAGSEIDVDRLPARIQQVGAEELERSHALGLTDFLNNHLTGVTLNAAQNNPLQPDLQYRGFSASPLLGLPQGLAVYQGGVRINEPFGDAVNWDLVPESAIAGMSLLGGANPLFGLNALGGALNLQMKTGFSYQGSEVGVTAGSFQRRIAGFQTGGNNDTWGYYFDAQYFDEAGWRALSDSDALNLYSSLSLRTEAADFDLNLQYADTDLRGNGSSPETLLSRDREAIFTAPDVTRNKLYMVALNAVRPLSDRSRLSGTLFARRIRTNSFNGDASEFAPCAGSPGQLCAGGDDGAAGEPLEIGGLDRLPPGTSLADFDAINNRSRRTQTSYGGTLQFDTRVDWAVPHDLIAGIAYLDGRTSPFRSSVDLARFDLKRSTDGSGQGPRVLDEETRAASQSQSYSSYLADSIDLTGGLTLLLAARYDMTRVRVRDRSSEHPEIDGNHRFQRLNPSAGLTYAPSPLFTVYGSYSESSRAPTAIELSCNEGTFERADRFGVAADECRLPNAFVADPPLDQVVAHSFELGLRGRSETMSWSLNGFDTRSENDIIFQTTGRATGVFKNIDQTRRYGLESELKGQWQRLDWFVSYSYVRALFEDRFDVRSPNHPLADDGLIHVRPGDSIPGTPVHQVKLGAEFNWSEQFSIGAEYQIASRQFLRGDESNQLKPVNGYGVFNLSLRYKPRANLELGLRVENLFNRDYETFGVLSSPAEGLPGLGELDDVRFLGSAPPRGIFADATLRW